MLEHVKYNTFENDKILEVENLILMYHGGLIYFVWLCEIWGCFGIPILFSRYKITEKQTLKSPLIPAASRSFEHLQQVILTI